MKGKENRVLRNTKGLTEHYESSISAVRAQCEQNRETLEPWNNFHQAKVASQSILTKRSKNLRTLNFLNLQDHEKSLEPTDNLNIQNHQKPIEPFFRFIRDTLETLETLLRHQRHTWNYWNHKNLWSLFMLWERIKIPLFDDKIQDLFFSFRMKVMLMKRPRLEVRGPAGPARRRHVKKPIWGHLDSGRNVKLWTSRTKVAQPAGPARPRSQLPLLAAGQSDESPRAGRLWSQLRSGGEEGWGEGAPPEILKILKLTCSGSNLIDWHYHTIVNIGKNTNNIYGKYITRSINFYRVIILFKLLTINTNQQNRGIETQVLLPKY